MCGPFAPHDVDLGKWHSLCLCKWTTSNFILLSFNMYELLRPVLPLLHGNEDIVWHCVSGASKTCSFWISLYVILFDSTHSKTNGVYERNQWLNYSLHTPAFQCSLFNRYVVHVSTCQRTCGMRCKQNCLRLVTCLHRGCVVGFSIELPPNWPFQNSFHFYFFFAYSFCSRFSFHFLPQIPFYSLLCVAHSCTGLCMYGAVRYWMVRISSCFT